MAATAAEALSARLHDHPDGYSAGTHLSLRRMSVSTHVPEPDPDQPMRPDQVEAAAKAEEIVGRREQPAFEMSRLSRPRSVRIGCILTWIGAAVLVPVAVAWLTVDDSTDFVQPDDTVAAADRADAIDTAVAGAHILGGFIGVWAITLAVFALLVWRGRRWAATALLVMAGLLIAFTIPSLFTAYTAGTILACVWSVVVVRLIRLTESAKDWYRALDEARRFNLEAH